MRTLFPNALNLNFAVCQAIDERDGVRQAIDLFRQSGGLFIYQSGLEPYPNPESLVWESGTLSCGVRHPALRPDEHTEYDVKRFGSVALERPRAHFACFPQDGRGPVPTADWHPVRTIRLGQATGFWEEEHKVDPVALGQVQLAGVLYPLFRPLFGYIDERADGDPPLDVYLRGEIPCLFWVNIFGPEHVERLGREFLQNAPVWRVVEFEDGGVMHIASESYMEWWHRDFTELRDYFRQRLPQIELYRGQHSEYS